jgi:hypothetical protein
MEVGRMKNHDVRIMYSLQPLSPVLYTRRCAMESVQFASKHPVAMNSVFLGTIPPSIFSFINSRRSARILFMKSGLCTVCNLFPQAQVDQVFRLGPLPDPPRKKNTG